MLKALAISAMVAIMAGCQTAPDQRQEIVTKAQAALDPCSMIEAAVTLAAHGIQVMPDSTGWDRWHWSPPDSGSPAVYYEAEAVWISGADTTLVMMIRPASDRYWVRVRGIDALGRTGAWSPAGWSTDTTQKTEAKNGD